MKVRITGRVGAGKTRRLFEIVTEGSKEKRVIFISALEELRDQFMTTSKLVFEEIDEAGVREEDIDRALKGESNISLKCGSNSTGGSDVLKLLEENRGVLNEDTLLVIDEFEHVVASQKADQEKDHEEVIDFLKSLDCDVAISYFGPRTGPRFHVEEIEL